MDIAANGTKGPILVVLPAGGFEMGGRETNEQPRHKVSLAAPFAIGVFEVSAAEFAVFCKATSATCPAQPWDNSALPAVNVSWAQAQAYAKWLSGLMNAEYRLPSEAEWEYVARGGSTTEYPLGEELLPTHARYSFRRTEDQPLAANDRSLNRNGFRVYHIVGNVREWVADSWVANYAGAPSDGSARQGGSEKVVRGGSYADGADSLRSAARLPLNGAGDAFTGFRLVRSLN
jgi:formylglycine-generating enzyme required for sulfatase activity